MTENFKGIEFVRISLLPKEQKEKIWKSLSHDKIIKIVKDQAVLSDCILVNDYLSWLHENSVQNSHQSASVNTTSETSPIQSVFSALALKNG